MNTKDIIIIVLIIAIVLVGAAFVGFYFANVSNSDSTNDTIISTNNSTNEPVNTNITNSTIENNNSTKSNNSDNYVIADDGHKIDLTNAYRVWSDQDIAYIYVDKDGYYIDGYIIIEDENGNINAFKDTRGD